MNKIKPFLLFLLLLLTACNEQQVEMGPFQLTKEEQAIYHAMKQDLDEKHLAKLSPISIAKIYVQSGIDKQYDVEYALYTDRQDHIRWTKKEDEKIPETDRMSIESANEVFNNLDKGKFIKTSEFEGYIEYKSDEQSDRKSGFSMIKDEDGIWNVAFMPIQ